MRISMPTDNCKPQRRACDGHVNILDTLVRASDHKYALGRIRVQVYEWKIHGDARRPVNGLATSIAVFVTALVIYGYVSDLFGNPDAVEQIQAT